MRKVGLLIGIMIDVILLAGCGWNVSSGTNQNDGMTAQSDTAETQDYLKVFVPYTEANDDAAAKGFQKALVQAENTFVDKRIEAEEVDTASYKIKIHSYAASNEMPDVFFCWSDAFLRTFLKHDMVLRLNSFLPEGTSSENDRYQAFSQGNDVYGLAVTYWYGVFYCNADVFEQYGLDYPETWDEMLEDINIFKENGVIPIACGLKDLWPAHLFTSEILLQLAGTQNYTAYAEGTRKCPYHTMLLVGQYLEELVDSGAFGSSDLLLNDDEACRTFAEGGAAMYFNSNINAGTISEIADPNHIEVIRFPIIPECQYPNAVLGKVSNGLCISSTTDAPEDAYELALFLVTHTAANSRILSPWTEYDETGKDSLEGRIQQYVGSMTEFANNYDVLLEEDKKDRFLDTNMALFQKKISSEEFAREMVEILNGESAK